MGKKKIILSLVAFAGLMSFLGPKAEAAQQHHVLNQLHYHTINTIYKTSQNCTILQNRVLNQYEQQSHAQNTQSNTQSQMSNAQITEKQEAETTTQQQAAQQQVTQKQADQQQADQPQAAQQQRVHHNYTSQRSNGHHNSHH